MPRFQKRASDLAKATARERDQTVGMVPDPVALDRQFTSSGPLRIGTGDKFSEVAIALQIFNQQNQWRRTLRVLFVLDQYVAATQRLHSGDHCRTIELDQPEQIDVIRNDDRGHPHFRNSRSQFVDTHEAINDGIFSVQSQVYKSFEHDGSGVVPWLCCVLLRVAF